MGAIVRGTGVERTGGKGREIECSFYETICQSIKNWMNFWFLFKVFVNKKCEKEAKVKRVVGFGEKD